MKIWRKIPAILLSAILLISCLPSITAAEDIRVPDFYVQVSSSEDLIYARYGAGTGTAILAEIPNGSILRVRSMAYNPGDGFYWGYTDYHGMECWVSLRNTTILNGYDGIYISFDVIITADGGSLNLRTGAGTRFPTMGEVPNGMTLRVTDMVYNPEDGLFWGYTSYNGWYGWISLRQTTVYAVGSSIVSIPEEAAVYIQPEPPAAQMPIFPADNYTDSGYRVRVYATAGAGLALKISPDSNAAVQLIIPEGEELMISQISGTWGYTIYNGYYGWVELAFTRIIGDYASQVPAVSNNISPAYYIVHDTEGEGLELRSAPRIGCSTYGPAYDGTVILATAQEGNWVYTFYNGHYGWMNLGYLAPWTGAGDSFQVSVYNTGDEGLALHETADESSVIFMLIADGTQLLIDSVLNGWGHTSCNGYSGWIWLANSILLTVYPCELPSSIQGPVTYYTICNTEGTGLELRVSPTSSCSTYGPLYDNTIVAVLAFGEGWAFVYCNGLYGWVNTSYLRACDSQDYAYYLQQVPQNICGFSPSFSYYSTDYIAQYSYAMPEESSAARSMIYADNDRSVPTEWETSGNIVTVLPDGTPCYQVRVEELPQTLEEFLLTFAATYRDESRGKEYDCTKATDGTSNILGRIASHFLCVNFHLYPGNGYEDYFDKKDPRGWWSGYSCFDGPQIDWIARHIFHLSDSDIFELRRQGEENGSFYLEETSDGSYRYYSECAGFGLGWMDLVLVAVLTDGQKLYVVYDLLVGDPSSPDSQGLAYAVLDLAEIGGNLYWTMYSNSGTIPEDIASLLITDANGQAMQTPAAGGVVESMPDWEAAYREFITAGAYKNSGQLYIENNPGSRILFGLHDMDTNGVPELYISNGDNSFAGAYVYIYDIIDGNVTYREKIWTPFAYGLYVICDPAYPGLATSYLHHSEYRADYYYFDQNGALTSETINQAILDPDTGYLGEDIVRTADTRLYDVFYPLDMTIALQVYDLEDIDWLFDYASRVYGS